MNSAVLRHLVLLVVGVLVVERHKAIDEVHASSPHRVPQGYLGDRRRLGRGRHAQLLAVSLGSGRGGMDVGDQLDLPALQLGYGIHARETENPHGGGQYGGGACRSPCSIVSPSHPPYRSYTRPSRPASRPRYSACATPRGPPDGRLFWGDEHVNGEFLYNGG